MMARHVEKYFLAVIQDFNYGGGSCLDGKGLMEDVLALCAPNLGERERAIYHGLETEDGKPSLEDDFTCVLLLRTEISFVLGFLMAARHFGIETHRFKGEIAPILQHWFCCNVCERWDERGSSKGRIKVLEVFEKLTEQTE
jgi:hypothetical protein